MNEAESLDERRERAPGPRRSTNGYVEQARAVI